MSSDVAILLHGFMLWFLGNTLPIFLKPPCSPANRGAKFPDKSSNLDIIRLFQYTHSMWFKFPFWISIIAGDLKKIPAFFMTSWHL